MLTEAMLTLTSYTTMQGKYGLLSPVTGPINAVCGKPVRVPPSYHFHWDKHLRRGLDTVFFQTEICLGERHTTGVSPEEHHPHLAPLHGPAPNLQRRVAPQGPEANRRGQDSRVGNSRAGWDKGVADP